MSSPSLSEFSSTSFISSVREEPALVLPDLAFSERAIGKRELENMEPSLSLTSFDSIINKLPGLVIENNIYHIKSPLIYAQLADLISYCKRVEELTLTDARVDQYPQVALSTLVRLSRSEDPEFPFLASLKHLHLVDADISLCYLVFCVTPSLEYLRISGVPQSHQITITCFMEDLAYNAPYLTSITLGPGLLSSSAMKTSLEFTHLRHLHIEDAAASLDFDFLHGLAGLPELEAFFIDARTAAYTERSDSVNNASKKPSSTFPRLLKLTMISKVMIMADLIRHLFPRAIKDVSLTMVPSDPPQSGSPFSQSEVPSGTTTSQDVNTLDRSQVITTTPHAPPELVPSRLVHDVATSHDHPTSLSIIVSLTAIVLDLNMKPLAQLKEKQKNKKPVFRNATCRLAEAKRVVREIAAEPNDTDISDMNSKIIRRLSAETELTAARLVLASVEIDRIVKKQENQKRRLPKKAGYTEGKRLELEVTHKKQLQIALECKAQLAAEHDRQLRLVAERKRQPNIEQQQLVRLQADKLERQATERDTQPKLEREQRSLSNTTSQADFAPLIQLILELGKLESVSLACLGVTTKKINVGHECSVGFRLPSDTFEMLLSNSTLVNLEIKGCALDCIENSFLNRRSSILWPASSLQTLRLPLEKELNSGISLPSLCVIALRFPRLLKFQTRISTADNQLFLFDKDEQFSCHGLDTLTIGGGSLITEDKVTVATFMWSLFPHLSIIHAHDEHEAEDWLFVHRIIRVCQKAQAMDHEHCCRTVGTENHCVA